MLTVAMPILKQNDLTSIQFVSEQPIKIQCSSATFPDGVPVQPENIIKAGYIVYRYQLNGSIARWDDIGSKWVSSLNVDPQPLFFKENTWQGVIVAVGQKDKATDEDKFSTNLITAFPQYSVQCLFQARDSAKQEHLGTSPSSAPVQISAVGGKDRAGLYMKPKMEPSSANEIGMFLKDAGLTAEQAKILIKEDGGGFRIQVVCSGSQIEIAPSGEIVLTPKSGQTVRVAGDLKIDGTVNIGGTLNVNGTVTALSYFP